MSNWQTLRLTAADVPRYFPNGQNVGIINGEASGGLVTVDLDRPEAVALAGRFLEPTLTSGRESVPDSHWWYVAPGLTHRAFEGIPKSASEGTVLELRSTDHQTVVEPSVHPSGEAYRWSRSGLEPLEIDAEALTIAGRRLAAAALIACHLPEPKERGGGGGRYHYALALAGYLLRHGQDPGDVEGLLKAAWDARSWRGIEREKRGAYAGIERAVRDTAEKLRRGDPATGGRALEGMVQGLPRKIADFLGWERFSLREGRGAYLCVDAGNAERLADRHGANLRYCYPWGKWLVYDGARWRVDDRGTVVGLAKDTARSIFEEAKEAPDDEAAKRLGKWASTSLSESKLRAMIALAQSEPGVPVLPEELDASPDLLNVKNGTVDLRTGELRGHRREDLITKMAPVEYAPDAEAPRFLQFLSEVFGGDEDLISFVRRFAGYSLSGATRERVFAILHGSGKNGKTTLVELLQDVLGDYATNTATETVLSKRNEGINNDVAALKGARFVSAAEVEQGRHLAESKVKNLTGSDTVSARFLYSEPFDFKPEFKLWLSTNNKPVIRGTDDAIWDRIRLIPFNQRFAGDRGDPRLPEKLRGELPGVLAWMVRGCLEWQRDGLGEPEKVRTATEGYRSEMDVLGAFLTDCCDEGAGHNVAAKDLYTRYKTWCEENGETAEKQRTFGSKLTDRGYERYRGGASGGHRWRGLTLGKSAICRGSDPTDPPVIKVASKDPRVVKNGNSGSDGSDGSVTAEQEARIEALMRKGFAESAARAEVLAADHPIGCGCEVCL